MRASMLPILVIGLGVAGFALTRLLLIPVAKGLQARRGYSDQFVTDLALAVPLAGFGIAILTSLIWLAR